MKRFFIIFNFLLPLLGFVSAQTSGNSILGLWTDTSNTSHFKFYRSGNSYSAKLVWLKNPNDEYGKPKTDKNNPDDNLRSRQIIGINIISGLEFRNNQWINGKAYAPRRGAYVDCQISMLNDSTLEMKFTKSIFTSIKTWKRIKE